MKKATFSLRARIDGEYKILTGRPAWMLKQLVEAGPDGVKTIDNPAPRMSEYVRKLRKEEGLAIETVMEAHDGLFPGRHGRYVLRSSVEILISREAAL